MNFQDLFSSSLFSLKNSKTKFDTLTQLLTFNSHCHMYTPSKSISQLWCWSFATSWLKFIYAKVWSYWLYSWKEVKIHNLSKTSIELLIFQDLHGHENSRSFFPNFKKTFKDCRNTASNYAPNGNTDSALKSGTVGILVTIWFPSPFWEITQVNRKCFPFLPLGNTSCGRKKQASLNHTKQPCEARGLSLTPGAAGAGRLATGRESSRYSMAWKTSSLDVKCPFNREGEKSTAQTRAMIMARPHGIKIQKQRQ